MFALLSAPTLAAQPESAALPELRLRVVGGVSSSAQFMHHEQPFWTRSLAAQSGGRFTAEIAPFDRSGIQGADMLHLMRLGVVPLGTAPLQLIAIEEPTLGGVDLPGLNPDIGALRRSVAAYRQTIEAILRERYGIKALAIYANPAQRLSCSKPFSGLDDLAGRRVRSTGLQHSDFIEALGAIAVRASVSTAVPNKQGAATECVIAGAIPSNASDPHHPMLHVHSMAVLWGISVVGANADAWSAMPSLARALIESGLKQLESEIWETAARETELGPTCGPGQSRCMAKRGVRAVSSSEADDRFRRRMLTNVILPRWMERCGRDCAETWNKTVGQVARLSIRLN